MKKIGKKEALFVAKRMKTELIYNMAKSEGNTLDYAETATVVEGISVGGKKMFELKQIENIRDGWNELIYQCENNLFQVSKLNYIHINSLVAKDENIELGGFRTREVSIGGTKWTPPIALSLNAEFSDMKNSFTEEEDIKEKAYNLFLDSARNQFFADGNKRTAQLIMNGVLIENGYSLFSIPEEFDKEYKKLLIAFYETGDKKDIIDFMEKCQALNDIKYNCLEQQETDPIKAFINKSKEEGYKLSSNRYKI